jgi:protein SCO1
MLRSLRAAALAAVVALAGMPGAMHAGDSVPPAEPAGPPRIGGHFSLTAADGTAVTDRSFPGKWLLLYFGYTFCPDACPTALNTIAEALDELGPLAERIQPIFITVDPQRDTPAVITEYVKAFHPRLIGLTGSAAQIAAAAKDFHVFYEVRQLGNEEYAIDHSSYIYVIDPDGRVTDLMTGNLPGHPVAAELKRLIQ